MDGMVTSCNFVCVIGIRTQAELYLSICSKKDDTHIQLQVVRINRCNSCLPPMWVYVVTCEKMQRHPNVDENGPTVELQFAPISIHFLPL